MQWLFFCIFLNSILFPRALALAPFKLLGKGISKLLGISSAKQVGKIVSRGGLQMFKAIPMLKAIPDIAFATIDLMQGKYKAAIQRNRPH